MYVNIITEPHYIQPNPCCCFRQPNSAPSPWKTAAFFIFSLNVHAISGIGKKNKTKITRRTTDIDNTIQKLVDAISSSRVVFRVVSALEHVPSRESRPGCFRPICLAILKRYFYTFRPSPIHTHHFQRVTFVIRQNSSERFAVMGKRASSTPR